MAIHQKEVRESIITENSNEMQARKGLNRMMWSTASGTLFKSPVGHVIS